MPTVRLIASKIRQDFSSPSCRLPCLLYPALLFFLLAGGPVSAQYPCSDFDTIYNKGQRAFENEDLTAALQHLKAAEACDPRRKDQIKRLERKVYQKMKQQEVTRELLDQLREKNQEITAANQALADTMRILAAQRDIAQNAEEQKDELRRLYENNSATLTQSLSNPTMALRMAEFNLKTHPDRDFFYKTFQLLLKEGQSSYFWKDTTGHYDQVAALEFFPDGKALISASHDQTAKMWDSEGNFQKLLPHDFKVNAIAMRPDGKAFCTGTYGGTIHVWNHKGEEIEKWRGHTAAISSLKFSKDGDHLFSSAKDGTVAEWEVKDRLTRSSGATLEITGVTTNQKHAGSHYFKIYSLSLGPDGTMYTAGYGDRIFQWREGQKIDSFPIDGVIYATDIDPTGNYLVTGTSDNTAMLWNLKTGNSVLLGGHSNSIFAVRFSQDGKKIITASSDHSIRVWDLNGAMENQFRGHKSTIFSLALSPDGKLMASGSEDGNIKIWKTNQSALERELDCAPGGDIGQTTLLTSPDGNTILSARGEVIQLRDFSGQLQDSFVTETGREIQKVVFHPNGNSLICGGLDNLLIQYDLTGQEIRRFQLPDSPIRSLAISPGGKWLAAGSGIKTLSLFALGENREIPAHIISEYPGKVASIDFSPYQEDHLLVAKNDFNMISQTAQPLVLVLDTQGKLIWPQIVPGAEKVETAVFAPNGDKVLIGLSSGKLEAWSLDKSKTRSPLVKEETLEGHTEAVPYISFSADGKQLVTGSTDRSVKVWDYSNNRGRMVQALPSQGDSLIYLAFGSLEGTVVTGTQSGQVNIWSRWPRYLAKFVDSFPTSDLVREGLDLTDSEIGEIKRYSFEELGHLAKFLQSARQSGQARGYINKRIEIKNDPKDKIELYQLEPDMSKKEFDRLFLVSDTAELAEFFQFFRAEGRLRTSNEERAEVLRQTVRIGEQLLPRLDNPADFKRTLSEAYNSLGWHSLLIRDFPGCETAILRGLEIDSTNKYLYTNLAPSLLFQGKMEAARALYREKMGEEYYPQRGLPTYREVFLKDFIILNREGVIPPEYCEYYEEILAILEGG